MKRITYQIFIAFGLITPGMFSSCNSGNPTSQNLGSANILDTASANYGAVKTVLVKQLKRGSSMETSATAYKKEDFAAVVTVAAEILKKNGYKQPTDFAAQVKIIFGDKGFDPGNLNALNYNTGCLDKERQFMLDETGGNKYDYLDFKKGLLTRFYPLPLLINYQEDFPGLAKLEDKPGEIYDAVEHTHKKNETWRDWTDLPAQREHNIHQIISRNKFLFNHSKDDFEWLKNNDPVFLDKLVAVFGYVTDKELTQWALDKNLITSGNEDAFGGVLWNQDCNGKINIHQAVFDLIKAKTKDADTRYLNSIAAYIIYLRDKEKLLSLADKAEVMAKVAYYAQKIVNKNEKQFEQDYYTRFLFPVIQTQQSKALFEPEFKKHQYYNLPGFKKLWDEQLDYNGGVGQPM